MSELRFSVCKKIKELRLKRKRTQLDLAYNADIDYKYLQKIESKDPPNISLKVLEKLAKALNVRPSKFFTP